MRIGITLTAVCVLSTVVFAGPIAEDIKITPADLAQDDRFGTSIDANEGVAAIGSRLHDGPALNSGAVYLYDTSTGAQLRKVLVPDSSQGSGFGNAVAIEMSSPTHYLLVGKEQDRDEGIDAGAVYVFHADTGAFLYKIRTPDGGGSKFGATIAIEGNIAVIGAPESSVNGSRSGRAFIYDLSNGSLLHTLEAQTPQSNALFGCSVDISDGLVIVGARRETPNGPNSGSAYVFNAQSGLMLARFTAPDNDEGDQFGNAVAISNPVAIVGALAEGENGANAGAAYVYTLDDPTSPVMAQKLLAPDGVTGDEFGVDVDIHPYNSTYTAVVGAWKANASGSDSGSAYRFELLEDGTLFSSQNLLASDASADAFLGSAVSIDGDGTVFVGAPEDNANFPNGGGVYVYAGCPPLCPADINGDGTLNFFDVSAFLTAFQSQNPIADINGDGLFNFFDVSAFLTAFNAGCP